MPIYDGRFKSVLLTGSVELPQSASAKPANIVGTLFDGKFIDDVNSYPQAATSSPDPDPEPTGSTGSATGCPTGSVTSVVYETDYTISIMSSSISQYNILGCTGTAAPFSLGAVSLLRLRTQTKAPYTVLKGPLNSSGTLFPLGTNS